MRVPNIAPEVPDFLTPAQREQWDTLQPMLSNGHVVPASAGSPIGLSVPSLKKGDRVNVWQKPLTDQHFEGEARLVRLIIRPEDSASIGEYWTVDFEDGYVVPRWIHPRHIVSRSVVSPKIANLKSKI